MFSLWISVLSLAWSWKPPASSSVCARADWPVDCYASVSWTVPTSLPATTMHTTITSHPRVAVFQ
jgi:hypothetical protein